MNLDPALLLNDENLEYYKNVQYLKEMTKQATALIRRSNALYNNIIPDMGTPVKARGLSVSVKDVSIVDDSGHCDKCGLVHGANFCILEQIMNEEIWKAEHGWEHERPSVASLTVNTGMALRGEMGVDKPATGRIPAMTTDLIMTGNVREIYDMVSSCYGRDVAERFLKFRSIAGRRTGPLSCDQQSNFLRPSAVKTKAVETTNDCDPSTTVVPHKFICQQYSEEVQKKMQKILNIVPPCQHVEHKHKRRWKSILRKTEKRKVKSETTIDLPVVETFEPEQIFSSSVHFEPVTTKCQLIVDPFNNHMRTICDELQKRREESALREICSSPEYKHKPQSKRFSATLFQTHTKREDAMRQCLTDVLPHVDFDYEVDIGSKVSAAVRMIEGPALFVPIDEEAEWAEDILLSRIEQSEGGDSQDESFIGVETSDDESICCESPSTRFESHPPPRTSRIPFAGEIDQLIDNLFDKISVNFEKTVRVNTSPNELSITSPIYERFIRELTLNRNTDQRFDDILRKLPQKRFYPKHITPFERRKYAKQQKLQMLTDKVAQKQKRVDHLNNIQKGFVCETPIEVTNRKLRMLERRRRQILNIPEPERWTATCDFVRNDTRSGVNKENFHSDYKWMTHLFSKHGRAQVMEDISRGRVHSLPEPLMGARKISLPKPSELYGEQVSRATTKSMRQGPPKEDLLALGAAASQRDAGKSRSETAEWGSFRTTSKESATPLTRMADRETPSAAGVATERGVLIRQLEIPWGNVYPQDSVHMMNEKRMPEIGGIRRLGEAEHERLMSTSRASSKSGSVLVPPSAFTASSTSTTATPSIYMERYSHGSMPNGPQPDPRASIVSRNTNAERQSWRSVLKTGEGPQERSMSSAHAPEHPKTSSRSSRNDSQVAPRSVTTNNEVGSIIKSQSVRASKTENSVKSKSSLSTDTRAEVTSHPDRRSICAQEKAPERACRVSGMSTDLPEETWTMERPPQVLTRASLATAKNSGAKKSISVKSDFRRRLTPNHELSSGESYVHRPSSQIDSLDKTVVQSGRGAARLTTTESSLAQSSTLRQNVESSSMISMYSKGSTKKMVPRSIAEQLGPTKRRSFGVDIGQGIHYIEFLKANAVGADSQIKNEILDLMTVPRERRRKPPKPQAPELSKTGSTISTSSTRSLAQNSNRKLRDPAARESALDITKRRLVARPTKDVRIKTLDEIFKEVHNINKQNTPSKLVDFPYEHEWRKMQQLRRHREGTDSINSPQNANNQ